MRSRPRARNHSAVLALSGVLALTGCTALKRAFVRSQLEEVSAVLMPEGTDLTALAPDLYTFRWLGYRTTFLATPDGVILFDPINAEAARAVALEIARVAQNPAIRYVVYTHHHRDHAAGAAALPGRPEIVAHENAARSIAGPGHEDVTPPTRVFSGDSYDLTLGGSTVRLVHLLDSHSDGLLAAYIPHRRALVAVDVFTPRQMPNLGPPGPKFFGLKSAISQLLAFDFDVLVPGHGEVADRAALLEYRGFLDDLEAAFRGALAARGLSDLGRRETFRRGQKELADIFFEVEDRLRPKYGSWALFDSQILMTTQWVFVALLLGE